MKPIRSEEDFLQWGPSQGLLACHGIRNSATLTGSEPELEKGE